MKHVDRFAAEKLENDERKARRAPRVLLSDALQHHEDSARALLEGLRAHYMPCLLAGRLEAWSAAAKSIADLLADAPESPRCR